MTERTAGKISIHRDHPDAATAAVLIHLRADDRDHAWTTIADIYCAEAGSEQAANAEFIVHAWNSHDDLLAALRRAALALAFAAEHSPAMQDDYNAVSAAIAKATAA